MNEKEQYLDKQCGLNQHSGQVDGHNCLKEKRLKVADNVKQDNDDDIYIMVERMYVSMSRLCLFCLPPAKLTIYI